MTPINIRSLILHLLLLGLTRAIPQTAGKGSVGHPAVTCEVKPMQENCQMIVCGDPSVKLLEPAELPSGAGKQQAILTSAIPASVATSLDYDFLKSVLTIGIHSLIANQKLYLCFLELQNADRVDVYSRNR